MNALWVLFFLTSTSAHGSWISSIQPGSHYERTTAGHYPFLVNQALNRWVSWDPQDTLPNLSQNCSKNTLQSQLMKSSGNKQWNQIFADYSKTCGTEAFQEYGPQWLGPLRLFSMEYPALHRSPLVKKVLFHLPNGQKLKGLLAIRDNKPRPFVILRMGITGGIEEAYAERYFYHHIFERGFSHFLMVENMTSSDFVENNKKLEFGGINEGFQNIWLAQKLTNPQEPLSKVISSLHLMGISLGGQGVLTASWLQPAQDNPRLYQSFLGLCPLVDTPQTFERLFQKDFLRFPLEFWARARFSSIRSQYPQLFDWSHGFGLVGRLLEVSARQFKVPSPPAWGVRLPSFIQQSDGFEKLHTLSKWHPRDRLPIQIWSTRQDRIVAADINSQSLLEADPMMIDQGHHCSFPVHWHPHTTQALFNAHILQTANSQLELQFRNLSAPDASDWTFYYVKPSNKTNLEVFLFSPSLNRSASFVASPMLFDFNFEGRAIGPWEIKLMQRWLSTNLEVSSSKNSQVTVRWPSVKPILRRPSSWEK